MTSDTDAKTKQPTPAEPTTHGQAERAGIVQFFSGYFWFIVKNVIGWTFILGSLPLGLALPGPGGIPVFLIGFALVTFPGKRRLTSRVMRGRGLPIEAEMFTFVNAVLAILVTSVLMWIVSDRYERLLAWLGLDPRVENPPIAAVIASLIGIGIIALGVTWVVMRLSLQVVNYILRAAPMIRRRVRPWMRKHGFNLLPSRRKRKVAGEPTVMRADDEILEIHERHHHRLRVIAAALIPWAKRAIAVGVTIGIFVWILHPIFEQWEQVRGLIYRTNVLRFILAAAMFAVFLFVFRALAWRRILHGFGFTLPVAASTRIWITSELARYVPGVIWQVVGRVYLARPYGVPGTIVSVSQVLELSIFLLANLLVALACLVYFGIKNIEGPARTWMYVAAGLVPVMLVLLHPRVFYGIINPVVKRLGRPLIASRLGGPQLLGLLIWNCLGLLWQALALYLILERALHLKLDWWWILAGSYCLAWTAGFLAVWAPAGIGVRELVFVTAMNVALPASVQRQFTEPDVLLGFLAFLSVLLRVWTTAGELILATAAYSFDLRGALNLPTARGRVPVRRLTDLDSAV